MDLKLQIHLVNAQGLLPPHANVPTNMLVTALDPQRNPILRLANGDDGADHLIAVQIEGLSNHRENGKHPRFVADARLGNLFGNRVDEFSAVLVDGVFPGREDAFAEDVIIGI